MSMFPQQVNPWQTKKVLISIKTYPNPSMQYQETVCTAGVTDKGEWIRLYPITFRYLPYDKQFKKYHWIEVDVKKHNQDIRPESFRPIETVGDHHHFKHPTKKGKVTVTHPIKDTPIKTVKSIFKQAGITLK